jgi:hypothetical protein
MSDVTTIIGNNPTNTCIRVRQRPRRHNKGSKDCGTNTTDNRAQSDPDSSRDIQVTQPRSTREATRTKTLGPSRVIEVDGSITGLAHRDHVGTTSSSRHCS